MAFAHVRFAFDRALDVSGSELLVLVALAEWADDDGLCWPSHDSIAKRARVSRRQVIRLLQSLVNRGLIEVDERRQRSNTYRLKCDIAMSQEDVTPDVTSDSPTYDTAMAHVTSDPDVTSGASHVTSRVSHVTSGASDVTRLCHPNNHIEQPDRTTTKNNQGIAAAPKSMPANGPVQELVKLWYERAGGEPVNWGKAMGHGKTLVRAKVTGTELWELYDWLASNPWNKASWSFDLGTAVALLEQFRQSKRLPKSNGWASPGKLSNYDISAANIDAAGEPDDPFGIVGPIYETTGRIRP